jgi:hypothetical protein
MGCVCSFFRRIWGMFGRKSVDETQCENTSEQKTGDAMIEIHHIFEEANKKKNPEFYKDLRLKTDLDFDGRQTNRP